MTHGHAIETTAEHIARLCRELAEKDRRIEELTASLRHEAAGNNELLELIGVKEETNMTHGPVSMERTAKKYKAGGCLGTVLAAGGLMIAVACSGGHVTPAREIVGNVFSVVFFAGTLLLLVSAFLAWWHSG